MFAGAAFTDQADIKATDAVNMLSSLGVITGYTDGSYQPNKVVTRAEMAKMIFVVRNNKIDDSAYQSNYSKLTDIANHWAKGYIKFCESQGIIAGKGNNKFDPDSPVTGVEAAKMLLVVAGYDTDKAGLTGSAWRTNTLKYAGAAGILDDVNAALEQGLPRQYAAQMIYNTLDVNRVKWSKDSESFDDVLNGGVKETVGHAYMGLCSDYGTLTDISKDSLTIKLDVNYESDNYHAYSTASGATNTVKFTKVDTDYTSLLGQKVKIMFKDGKLNNVLGVYAIADNTVYTTLLNKVEKDGDKIKFDGTSYSVDSNGIYTTTVGVSSTTTATKTVADFDKGSKGYNTSLNEVTFVDSDGDNKIDTAIVIEKTAAKVTYASSSEIVAGDTYKAADENIAEGFAKDDYAVVSKNLYKDNKDVVKADVLNDTVNGFKTKTGYVQYKIGSTWYNAAKEFSDVDTGDKVKAYVVNGVALDISSDDSNGALPTVAVVTGIGGDTITGDQVKLTFFDGTTKTVTLDKVVESDGTTKMDAALGTAYSYSESKDGYKLTQLSGKKYNDYEAKAVITSFANTVFTNDANGKPTVLSNGTAYSGYSVDMDDTAKVVLVQASGKCKVVTGKQYKALTTVDQGKLTSAFTKKTNGLTKIMLASAYVNDVDQSGSSNDNYAYIVKDGYKTGDNRTAYTIWDGEKNVDVVEKINYNSGDRAKGMVVGYSTIDEDGYINDVQTYTGSNFAATPATKAGYVTTKLYYAGVQGVNGDSWVTVDGVNKLNITKDTKILNVDSDADDDDQIGKSGSALFAAEEIADSGVYYTNAYFVMDEQFGSNDNADLAFIVFDVKGKMKGMNEDSTAIAKSGTVTGATCTADTFEAGKSYDLVLTAATSSEQNVTLTGAVFAADGKSTTQKVTFDATGKATVKVIALGTAITVTGAAHV